VQQVFYKARDASKITKRISVHSLRRYAESIPENAGQEAEVPRRSLCYSA
jgi:hypothetical protein